jgi:hypothetical protein
MLGQSTVSTLLFTVHGHVRPISGNECCGGGLRGSLPSWRAPHVPRVRQKYVMGFDAPVLTLQGSGTLMTSWGSDEAETATRGAYLARDLSVRLRRDRGWLSVSSD